LARSRFRRLSTCSMLARKNRSLIADLPYSKHWATTGD
jgi:hypothetical protein